MIGGCYPCCKSNSAHFKSNGVGVVSGDLHERVVTGYIWVDFPFISKHTEFCKNMIIICAAKKTLFLVRNFKVPRAGLPDV